MTLNQTTTHHDDAQESPTFSRLRDNAKTVSSSDEDIRGRVVKDKDGQDLGKIEGLMIDDLDQRVRFLEVASGGLLGFGERKSFIPVETITQITADEVHIDRTRAHVAGAPSYDPAVVTQDAGYFFSLYPYYGYEGSMGFIPTTSGYPYVMDDKPPTGERGG